MFVYRIGKTRYANDLSGEGARLFGGRWNHKLTACIYTSESRALAVLEYTVNVNMEAIPRALSFTVIEIPSSSTIYTLTEDKLPGNWNESPAPAASKDFGTLLLKAAKTAIIKIPSAIITRECNYLLNPAHINSKAFKIVEISDFVYDVRIKG